MLFGNDGGGSDGYGHHGNCNDLSHGIYPPSFLFDSGHADQQHDSYFRYCVMANR